MSPSRVGEGFSPGYSEREDPNSLLGILAVAQTPDINDGDEDMSTVQDPMPSSPSNLCPACTSGLCDTHIQLTF